MKWLIVILLAVFCANILANKCTDECDAYKGPYNFLYGNGGNVTFCGTDHKTHNTFRQSILNFTYTGCYAKRCNIGILYPGVCGCPNNCSAADSRGKCVKDQCVCEKGWGGKDCSNVVCPTNKCSGHGKCVAQKEKDGGDMCQCNNGWTATDCSTPVPGILADRLPYGQIFPGQYYSEDEYGDFHPVLNASLVSTVRLTVSDDTLDYIFTPRNTYNQTDSKCDVYVYNGYVSKYIKKATVALHGALGRVYPKKSFNVKFDDDWKELTGFMLMANTFDRFVSNQLMGEFHRAMMSETYRMSLAEVWVNEVYYGLYTMMEKINNHFEESRFGVKDNDMYKFGIYDLQYLGYNPVPYQNAVTNLYEIPRELIIKKEGDDSWVKFVDLVTALNSTKAVRDDYLRKHFDVDGFLRAIALEAITMDYDGYAGCGNNYYLTDVSTKNTAKPYWKWTAFDFQAPLDGLNIYQNVLAFFYYQTSAAALTYYIENRIFIPPNDIGDNFLSTNPYKFIYRPEHPKPLLLAVFGLPEANATYTLYMQKFLKTVYVNNNAKMTARYYAYDSLVRPSLTRDLFYNIDGTTVALYDDAINKTYTFSIEKRFSDLVGLIGLPPN